MRKLKILVGTACLLVVAGLWFWRFQITEEERVQISDVVYSAGEAVPFGENFFWSNSENSNGYTITVDSAQTRNVREFLEENGASWEEVYPETENALPPSEVVYLVTATVSNESNEDGMVQFSNFVMTSGSILLQLDGDVEQLLCPGACQCWLLCAAGWQKPYFHLCFHTGQRHCGGRCEITLPTYENERILPVHFPCTGTKADPYASKYRMNKKSVDLIKKRRGMKKGAILYKMTFIWQCESEVGSYEA